MHFDIQDLRLMAAIAETNSLTRGAERCHLSLPAVSVRVKNIEESFGTRLLYRSPQGVTLTPAGQSVVQHARLILGQMENLRSDMQEYARGIKGHLRLFASITAIAEFLPPVLSEFLATHPDVNIDLREKPSVEVVRAVSEGETDLGIVSGPVRTEGLQTRPYRTDRLVLVVPLGHPLAGRGEVAFADTLGWDHVGLPHGTGIHTFLSEKARELGAHVHQRIQMSSFETSCRMIAAGVGVGVMPQSAALRCQRHDPIRILQLQDDWALRRLVLCARNFELLPGFAHDLVELLLRPAPDAA